MLAFIGLGCAFTLTVKNNWYLLLGLANFAILVFTGSRSGILASIFVLVGYLFVQARSVLRGRVISSINLLALLGTIVLVFFAYLPNLEARMAGNSSGMEDIEQGDTAGDKQGDTAGDNNIGETGGQGNVNTSGRSVAWDFLLEEAMENPLFGRGLGAGTIVGGQVTSEGEIVNPAFRAPHNEYLRMFVDGGVVGTLLILLGFGIVFRRILQSVRAESKLYLATFLFGFAVYSLTDNTLSTIQFFIPFCWYLGVLYTQDAQAIRS
jgi:teichuronic acid biosynthesis protein TuaE